MKNILIFMLMTLLFSSQAQAFSDNELSIWLGGDKAYNGLIQIGKQFEKETGIKIKVENPEGVTGRFQQAASSNQGPDILFWAHDRLGGWAEAGLLHEIKPSEALKEHYSSMGWDAMTHKGKIYGYPVSLEAIGLLYNKKLIQQPPLAFEDMFDLNKKFSKQNIDTLIWFQTEPYFTAPFLMTNGGYVFKQTNGIYDIKNTGVNNEGALIGAKLLTDFIEQGVTPKGADFSVAEARFAKGQSAMIIAGPWSWSNFDKVGVDFGVAPLPSIKGDPAKPFVGVWGGMLNNASPNKAIAKEFMEQYVLTRKGLEELNRDVPLGVVAHNKYREELIKNPRIAATYKSVQNGVVMPNIPQMGGYWKFIKSALNNIMMGRETADKALNRAAKQIVE